MRVLERVYYNHKSPILPLDRCRCAWRNSATYTCDILFDHINFLSKLLVVALGVIFRDADVLVHVERLHILEAHFSSLVRLREKCDDGNIIILIAHLDQFLIHPKGSSSCNKNMISMWTSLVLMSNCAATCRQSKHKEPIRAWMESLEYNSVWNRHFTSLSKQL